MSRFNGSTDGKAFTGRFREGDQVVVTADPPESWMPHPRGTIWRAVPTRSGYLVRYSNGAIVGWCEDDLRLTVRAWLRRAWRWLVRR